MARHILVNTTITVQEDLHKRILTRIVRKNYNKRKDVDYYFVGFSLPTVLINYIRTFVNIGIEVNKMIKYYLDKLDLSLPNGIKLFEGRGALVRAAIIDYYIENNRKERKESKICSYYNSKIIKKLI